MSKRAPVQDWATDFDHRDGRWVENPFAIWDALRKTCPVAHSTRFEDGAYFVSRYADVRAIAYDSEHFSSRRVIVREHKVPTQPAPPITSDPPEHTAARKLLLPAFAPQAIAKLEQRARAVCRELLDAIGDKAACDAAVDYAQHIPVRLLAHMLGVPESDGDKFRHWIHLLLEVGISDETVLLPTLQEMNAYFLAEIQKRGDKRGDDLISFLLDARIDGQPLPDPHLLGTLRLLLIAGIDTTWSAIGSCLWHLAGHPQDRRRLVAEPSIMSSAVEEFLRAYAPVTMAREVVKETRIGGCTFTPGHMVLLSFPAANRDPAEFPEADRVVLDRKENRHAAFGLGIHRCVGSNLARMEIRVALEEWLRQIPDFRLDPQAPVTWSQGTVRGPRRLPVLFGA